MTDIFFSYRSVDRERVRPVHDAFAKQGFEVFWDQEVPLGDDWDVFIRQRLTKLRCVVAFWSVASIVSPNVRHEAAVAQRQGKLISVYLDTLTPDDLPLGHYFLQAVSLVDWNGDFNHAEWRKLVRHIETKVMPQRASAQSLPTLRVRLFSATSDVVAHPTARAHVPAEYKIIGGGARVDWNGAGNLLTKSFPEGDAWVVESKDHRISSPARITAYAIAIFDPEDRWDVMVAQNTSSTAAHPSSRVVLPNTYVMTGGGARVDWVGAGNFLTASYPDSSHSWMAGAKDHIEACPATVTAYIIGVRHRTNSALPHMQIFSAASEITAHPFASVQALAGYVTVGGGAFDNWAGVGNLLTASSPFMDLTGWVAAGKDHEQSDPSRIMAYAIGLRNVSLVASP